VKAFPSGLSSWPSPSSRQTRACLRLCAARQQQFPPTEKQIDQRASDKQPVRVLLQSSVAQLHESELQLHQLKCMLHLRTHARFASVLRPLLFVNPILITITTMGVVLRARCALLNYMALSLIGLITPHPGFFPMQQIGKHRRVGDVRRRSHCRVDDLALAIHPHMGFHAEVASRPRVLPPQPLSDPYVTLSRHTAPIIQPDSQLHASGETTAVRHPSSCAATAHCPAFVPIRPCTSVWPTVRARDQYAGKHGAWLSDRMPRNNSTTLG